jgi:enoyl-CoA hydratase
VGQLALDLRDGIAVITFSNPPLQVMTPSTMNELNRMLPQLRSDEVRAIVFTGSDATCFIRHVSVEALDENTRAERSG